jgi:hypothetical protein
MISEYNLVLQWRQQQHWIPMCNSQLNIWLTSADNDIKIGNEIK